MLPGSGYYKVIRCPFFDNGFCERPYCHFKHTKETPPPPQLKVEPAVSIKPDPDICSSKQKFPATDAAPVVENVGPSLEKLVQEAVKKVLLGSGVAVNTSAVFAQVENIKEEREEEGDDSDCVIEEEVPGSDVRNVENVKQEQVSPPTKHKLYLPPADCAQYNPTPIKELQKKESKNTQQRGKISSSLGK